MASRTVSCSSVKPEVSISFLWGVIEKARLGHVGNVLDADETVLGVANLERVRKEERMFFAIVEEMRLFMNGIGYLSMGS